MIRRIILKSISLTLLTAFSINTCCYGLATLPASQNPIAKREISAALQRTQIRYAESEDAVRLLNANNASCLLLSSGKYLVTQQVAQDNIKLLETKNHEDVEAIMQICANEDRYKYKGIKELILKHFPPDKDNNLPINLYVNHTVARAFGWLLLVKDGVIFRDEIPPEEKGFIDAIEPIINANRRNYFTSEFWDSKTRNKKIRAALDKGMRFYQVASVENKAEREYEIKEDIKKVAQLLSHQQANIVFERNHKLDRWLFRRGAIEIKIPQTVIHALGNKMEKINRRSILFTLRTQSAEAIEKALKEILIENKPIQESFTRNGIPSAFEYKKVLLVPPYGDREGFPLKYLLPHRGVETISFRLIREVDNIDARVYNPNLGSIEELYKLVQQEKFDVIGFSILQLSLKENLRIIGKIHILSPESLIVLGGYDLHGFSMEDLFSALPCDICVLDEGTAFVQIAKRLTEAPITPFEERLKDIPNIVVRTAKGIYCTIKSKVLAKIFDIQKDIPIDEPDVTHGKSYRDFKTVISESFVALDRAGRDPLPILYGDFCRGRCIFCSIERNTRYSPPAQEVIDIIKRHHHKHDSINFDSADFLMEFGKAKELIDILKNSPFANIPKKVTVRVDSIGDGSIIKEMVEAGFKLIAYGIESFDDNVLRRIGKRTTRKQNIRALELTLAAGARPGINLVLFTPWDTVDTTLDTIEQSLNFVERGAYLNIVPCMNIIAGTPASKMKEIIEYKSYKFEGMQNELTIAYQGKILDEKLRKLVPKMLEIEKALEGDYVSYFARTVAVCSLLLFKAFYLAYGEVYGYDDRIREGIERTDQAIEFTISQMAETAVTGGVTPFYYHDYKHLAIPQSDEFSSLRMEEYIESKFPKELLAVIKNHQHRIEIHQGPQSRTNKYLEYLKQEGYSVIELRPNTPRIRKYYLAQRGDERLYIISNSIGYNRELFVVQALKFYGYPEERVIIRAFPFDLRNHLLYQLDKYNGKIKKVIIAHEIDTLVEPLIKRVDPGAKIIDVIKGDFIYADLVQLSNKQLILVCDIEYMNGEHVKPMLEFFADPIERRGLGVEEIVLYAACGSLNENVRLNDLFIPSSVYKYGEILCEGFANAIERNDLKRFIPETTNIDTAAFFTIPTVLSSSLNLVRSLRYKADKGAIELELAHAVETIQNYPNTKFHIIYEIHDKPVSRLGIRKVDTIGEDVPGWRDEEKRRGNLEGILKYLFHSWSLEDGIVKDAERVGVTIEKLPKMVFTTEALISEVNRAVEEIRKSDPSKQVLIGIGGVSGTGKTRHIVPRLSEALKNEFGEDSGIIRGDRFVLPKAERPLNLPYPGTMFNIKMMQTVIKALRQGKKIGFPIYDPELRRCPKLSNDQILELRTKKASQIQLPYYEKPVILIDNHYPEYRRLLVNPDSELAVFQDTGEVIEIINPNKKVFFFEVTAALLIPELRDKYDFSIFAWSNVETRKEYLLRAKKRGERYLHYDLEEIEKRFQRMQEEEDPMVFPTIEYANLIFVNEDNQTKEVGYQKILKTINVEGQDITVIDNEYINPELIRPPEVAALTPEEKVQAEKLGEEALKKGSVGLITPAGGLGSRAGLYAPKGVYPIAPLSKKTLFEMNAEELLAAGEYYGKQILWIIMTSDATDLATREYFAEKNYFGLGRKNIIFVKQENIAALETGTNKIAMEDAKNILAAPNGHGGIFRALQNVGARTDGGRINALEEARNRGIDTFFYCQIDNPLPLVNRSLLGFHKREGSEFTTVLVRKRDPLEGVAMMAVDKVTGENFFVEYNQPAAEIIRERKGYEYGSIARFVFSRDFLEKAVQPSYHIARGKKAMIFKDGKSQSGLVDKFESFSFDALSQAKTARNILLPRENCFAPFKTMEGPDSPESVRKALSSYWKQLVKSAIPEIEIPESAIIELSWRADYMTPKQLREKLSALNFSSRLKENVGLLVSPDFSHITVIENPAKKGHPAFAFEHTPKGPFTLQQYCEDTGVPLSTARGDFNILEELGLVSINRPNGGKPNEIECIIPEDLKPTILQILKTYRDKNGIPRIAEEIRMVLNKDRKCIVLDCDGILWDGIIGEDGIKDIRLTPAHLELQRKLKELKESGVILAINSKNNPEDVEEVLEKHPDMVLRRSDFAATKINWQDKASNMRELAEELNIGIDSLVFLDDSPHERQLARMACPEVLTPNLPKNPEERIRFIDELGVFHKGAVTEEDRRRTDLYYSQQKRRETQAKATSPEDFYRELGMLAVVRKGKQNIDYIARIAQLTQRTNQFNLTLKRYTEKDIEHFIIARDKHNWSIYDVYSLELIDKFGNNGIVGVIILDWSSPGEITIDTFCLSCRAIGLTVEQAFLAHVFPPSLEDIFGTKRIRKGIYRKGEKNSLVEKLYPNLGFKKAKVEGDNVTWELEPGKKIESPQWIDILRWDDYQDGYNKARRKEIEAMLESFKNLDNRQLAEKILQLAKEKGFEDSILRQAINDIFSLLPKPEVQRKALELELAYLGLDEKILKAEGKGVKKETISCGSYNDYLVQLQRQDKKVLSIEVVWTDHEAGDNYYTVLYEIVYVESEDAIIEKAAVPLLPYFKMRPHFYSYCGRVIPCDLETWVTRTHELCIDCGLFDLLQPVKLAGGYYPGMKYWLREEASEFSPWKGYTKTHSIMNQSLEGIMKRFFALPQSEWNEYIAKWKKYRDSLTSSPERSLISDIKSLPGRSAVFIAGPSSSGKTFISEKALTENIKNRKVLVLSLDRYYKNKEEMPRLPNGKADFETPEAVHLDWVREDIQGLLSGKEVDLPSFDMTTGKSTRCSGDKVSLGENDILIIESLYALKEEIIAGAKDHKIIKVFIDAPVELRLLRRLVRDAIGERQKPPYKTLERWNLVRERELEFVMPTRANADFYIENQPSEEFTQVLFTGSMKIGEEGLKHLQEIIKLVARLDLKVIVGDNPEGVDHAVVREMIRLGKGHNLTVVGADKIRIEETIRASNQTEISTKIVNSSYHEKDRFTKRDQEMVNMLGPQGIVYGIWNGFSPGTKGTFEYARNRGRKTVVFNELELLIEKRDKAGIDDFIKYVQTMQPDVTFSKLEKRILEVFPELDYSKGVLPYKMQHALAVIQCFNRLINKDFKYFYEELCKRGDVVSEKDYSKNLEILYDLYSRLSPQMKDDLTLAIILHDIGYTKTKIDSEHPSIGTELASPILAKANRSPESIKRILDIIAHHDYVGNVDRGKKVPRQLRELPNETLKLAIIANAMDMAGYVPEETGNVKNNLRLHILKNILELGNKERLKQLDEQKEYYEHRLRKLARYRYGEELSEDKLGQLKDEIDKIVPPTEKEQFINNWNSRIEVLEPSFFFGLADDVSYERWCKIFKFLSQAAELCLPRDPGSGIYVIDTDTDPRDISPQQREALKLLIDSIPINMTLQNVKQEMESNNWKNFYGLPIVLDHKHNKLTIKLKEIQPALNSCSSDELEEIDQIEGAGNLQRIKDLAAKLFPREKGIKKKVLFVTATGGALLATRNVVRRALFSDDIAGQDLNRDAIIDIQKMRDEKINGVFNYCSVPDYLVPPRLKVAGQDIDIEERVKRNKALLTEEEKKIYEKSMQASLGSLEQKHDLNEVNVIFLDDIYSVGLIPIIKERYPQIKLIWVNHREFANPPEVTQKFLWSYLENADAIVGWSKKDFPAYPQDRKDNIRNRAYILPVLGLNPLDFKNIEIDDIYLNYVRVKYGISGDRKIIFQLGRFVRIKDFYLTIRAYIRLKERWHESYGPLPQLVLAGPIDEEDKDDLNSLNEYTDYLVRERKIAREDIIIVGLVKPKLGEGFDNKDIDNARELLFRLSDFYSNRRVFSNYLKKTADALSAEDQYGREVLNHLEVNALQRMADLGIHVSMYEAFGMVIAELLWKGKPTIASTSGGVPKQYPKDMRKGFLMDIDQRYKEKLLEVHGNYKSGKYDRKTLQKTLGDIPDPAESLATKMLNFFKRNEDEQKKIEQKFKDHIRRKYLISNCVLEYLKLLAHVSNEAQNQTEEKSQYDTEFVTVLLTDLLYAQLHEDRTYEIKYDTSRLSQSQIDIIETYIDLLRKRVSNPDNIKARPVSSVNGSKESLIAVYCTGKDFKGEGHVDVSIPEGELQDYLLRIIGMMNMALASSNIPDTLSQEDVYKYRPLLSYIRNQYKAVLGDELAMPDSPADILKVIRNIILGLPKSMRMNLDQIEEYNRLSQQALIAA